MMDKIPPTNSAPSSKGSKGSTGDRIKSDVRGSNPPPRSSQGRVVVVHNGGGPSYEQRPVDMSRWR